MTWFWFWVLITGLPAGFVALRVNDLSGVFQRLFGFIVLFILFGIFTGFGLWVLSSIFDLGKGAVNWWNSLPDATGSSSSDNQVPPYFFLIPMFMILGFIIRGNGK
jgi:hypothetical protein